MLGADGLVQMNAKTKIPIIKTVNFMGPVTELMTKRGNARLSTIKRVAIIFAGLRMTPLFCQSIIGLDRVG